MNIRLACLYKCSAVVQLLGRLSETVFLVPLLRAYIPHSHASELIRRYTLDRAGIMFVTDLMKDTLTSPTPHRNAIAPEMDVIIALTYLATGKMQLCSSDDLGLLQHFQNRNMSLFISYKIC